RSGPRRLHARRADVLQSLPGVGHGQRPRLRHPRRRQAPRRARALAPDSDEGAAVPSGGRDARGALHRARRQRGSGAAVSSWQFDGVVRLTRIGVSFVLFTIFVGFAAINTGNNALYIGLSFMLGALLLSGIASKGGLKHLRVDFERVDEAWAGRPARGRLRVANRSRIWNVRDLILTSPDLAAPVFVAVVERRREVHLDTTFLFHRRGLVQLNTIDLYTRSPFGFFLKKRRVKIRGDVVVYPRLLDAEGARERFRPIEGEQHSASRPGPGSDVHAFREYTRGDSLRHVSWKKSASLGRW